MLSMPVTVLSREEDTRLTVYGGEFGARASASMNKEVERMIEEKEKQEGSNEGAQSRKEVRATLQTAARGSKNTWKEKEKKMGRHQASVHCEKTARKIMTKSRAKKLRQSKNGKASLDAEVWGITDISKRLNATHHS